jgi:hypothetical protein
MAKRSNPTLAQAGLPKMDAHESKLQEMHDALYVLGDKIRKPYKRSGEKLLPKDLQTAESDESRAARNHINALHDAMKGEK